MWLNACKLQKWLYRGNTIIGNLYWLEQKQIIGINKTSLRIITGGKQSRWLFVVFASRTIDYKKKYIYLAVLEAIELRVTRLRSQCSTNRSTMLLPHREEYIAGFMDKSVTRNKLVSEEKIERERFTVLVEVSRSSWTRNLRT